MSNPTYPKLKVQVQVIRDLPEDKVFCRCSDEVYELVKDVLAKADREKCLSLMLDSRNRVIGIDEVSVGSLTSGIIHPREVYKSAILANAAGIILAHNHPSSSSVKPSKDDITITKRVWEAGKIIGIDLIDHLIVGGNRFLSLKSKGVI